MGFIFMGVYVGVFMWGMYVGDVVFGDDVGNAENRMVTGFVTCWGIGESLSLRTVKPYTQLHTRVSPVPTHGCGGVGGGQWVVWGLWLWLQSFGVVAMGL